MVFTLHFHSTPHDLILRLLVNSQSSRVKNWRHATKTHRFVFQPTPLQVICNVGFPFNWFKFILLFFFIVLLEKLDRTCAYNELDSKLCLFGFILSTFDSFTSVWSENWLNLGFHVVLLQRGVHLWNLAVIGFFKSVEEDFKFVGAVHLVNLFYLLRRFFKFHFCCTNWLCIWAGWIDCFEFSCS